MTIEKRAKVYAKLQGDISLSKVYNESLANIYEDGYIMGAEEQRKIDIDKACKWFEGYLAEIGYPDDWCRDSEVQESGEKRFRKFMDANTVDDGIKRRTSKTWVLNGKKIRSYKKLVEELKKIEI